MNKTVASILVAHFGSRALLSTLDFNYRLFADPLHLGKLIIDLGAFLAIFFATNWLLNRSKRESSNE